MKKHPTTSRRVAHQGKSQAATMKAVAISAAMKRNFIGVNRE